MKKLFLFVVAAMLFATSVNAQSFANKDNVLGLTVGIGGGYGIPVSLQYERGVYNINNKMSIGVGGLVGYGGKSSSVASLGKWRYSNFLLGARGAWHYTGVKKLDLYAGLMLGYDVASAKFTWQDESLKNNYPEPTTSAGGFLWSAYVGARYYFTKNFGINAELGYGMAYLNLGIVYKF